MMAVMIDLTESVRLGRSVPIAICMSSLPLMTWKWGRGHILS